VDDNSTRFFEVYFLESKDGSTIEPSEDPPAEYAAYYKNDDGTYRMDRVWMQDYMAWETAGAVFDRTKEHLASADKGIIAFRKLLKAEVDKVRRGRDPLGVIRDPKKNQLVRFDTVTDSVREVGKSR
jgi:5,5'-dehydrodivanillate O-demethylase